MAISERLCQYFCCSETHSSFSPDAPIVTSADNFQFNGETIFGRHFAAGLNESFPSSIKINFSTKQEANPDKVIDNLRLEKYILPGDQGHPAKSIAGRAYYFVRPFLPVKVRRHLQKARLNTWHNLKFPKWPVDRTVDEMMAALLLLSCRLQGLEKIPFIWFWPNGATGAAVITHDVETAVGRDYCSAVMQMDASFGFRTAFEVVPERRYDVTSSYLDSIWARGFEVAVHDLNHDGHLFRDYLTFHDRVAKINAYGKHFKADGFRSAVLYRNQAWYNELDFSYDTSVPNVAHLDPQRGGCCTVMPYFIDNLVELPVTLTQDYSLFHILDDYSINLWKQQIELILQSHGLINVIIHPDYIISSRERAVVEALFAHLAGLREERGVWTALPKEVAAWWRQRSRMKLIDDEKGLRIEGEGKERARIAYAFEEDGQLAVELSPVQILA